MGTIRGDFCIDIGRNVCHGSDASNQLTTKSNYGFPTAWTVGRITRLGG